MEDPQAPQLVVTPSVGALKSTEARSSRIRSYGFLLLLLVLPFLVVLSYMGIGTGLDQDRGFGIGSKVSSISKITTAGTEASAYTPNIIFIYADDLAYSGFGKEWDLDLEKLAPNLHGMAQDGIVLDNYYAQELCTPSRAALLTGRYPMTVGLQYSVVQPTTPWALDLNETSIAEVLKGNGYTTAMLGKWHLGHQSPRYLPTARGFDSYIGYLLGDNYYFSKKCPFDTRFHDFIVADKDCYYGYPNTTDSHRYSTHFYTDKAIELLDRHDFYSSPLFLYLSYQAVHGPFADYGTYNDGVPLEYVNKTAREYIHETIPGSTRKEYAYSLNILDQSVGILMDKLSDLGQLEKSIVIFASDNGGCYKNGGLNAPYRGTKGSLFEGATKVDAFIYSPTLYAKQSGSIYTHLFHVSDWFPTLLDMAGIKYSPDSYHALDGISHTEYISSLNYGETTSEEMDDYGFSSNAPRQYMLYNGYYNTVSKSSSNGVYTFLYGSSMSPYAVRNNRYKLVQTFNQSGTQYSAYSDISVEYSSKAQEYGEDDFTEDAKDCAIDEALSADGTFEYYLFDLLEDPYETTNLYYSTDDTHIHCKELLEDFWDDTYPTAKMDKLNGEKDSSAATNAWKDADNTVVPWIEADDEVELSSGAEDKSYPDYCEISDVSSTI